MRKALAVPPTHFSPRPGGERGAELVEAAFVLPILLTLMFGLFVFAHGWYVYQAMTRAAREGVREAVTTSCATCGNAYDSNTDIENNVVFPLLTGAGFNTSNPVLTSSYAQGYEWLDQNQKVCGAYITFQYPYTVAIPFIPLNLGTVDLKTHVQMRLENDPNDGSCPP